METPHDVLDSAVDRAAEITWWNRQMTKLTEVDGVDNAVSFVRNELIERKGPYVEFVKAPAFQDQPAPAFLDELGYDRAVTSAVQAELFGGASGRFYQHQAETMRAIERDNNDNILAVPTATGKTESFFLPILQDCLDADTEGLKSIILYPMKTLGVDQLNRFIAYLDQINRHRDPANRITIGIWDSDTPQRVGTRDYEIEEGAYVRGLECPREDGDKLRVLGEMSVGTDDHQYSWVRVTRESIRQGVDILLTNPEALDYMFVSDNQETRAIVGEEPGANPVEHIVFDEAHIWSGIQGAAISLLSRRLKTFYAAHDPQVTMVSATVDNPTELASDLTGAPESSINSIGFTGRTFDSSGTPDFSRVAPCSVDDIARALTLAHVGTFDTATLADDGLGDAVSTLREVGLLAPGDPVTFGPAAGDWLTTPIDRGVDAALAEAGYETPADVVATRQGRNRVTEALLDASGTDSGWVEFVLTHVPEVATFAAWFDEETTGAVGFKRYTELVTRARDDGATDPEGALQTVMAFGRLAGIVTEKYHTFLKPPQRVYWCRDCERVTRNRQCPDCGAAIPELRFCKRCDEPYVGLESNAEDSDTDTFGPAATADSVDNCPGCGKWPKLTDVGVPTPTLFSYMLAEVCRATPSEKALVFSDSRGTAESVADQIIKTEYGLMAETLYLQELIDRGGRADGYDIYLAVAERLQAEYWEPLIQNDLDEDGTAYNFLKGYQDEISEHALLFNCNHLLDSALVTAAPVVEPADSDAVVVRHEFYKLFALNPNTGFTKNGIEFRGLTREKLVDRLVTRTGFDHGTVREYVDDAVRAFLDCGILSQQSWEEVQRTLEASRRSDEDKQDVLAYFERARTELVDHGLVEQAESGLLTRISKRDESDLTLQPTVVFCASCYRAYPTPSQSPESSLTSCPHCQATVSSYRRFSEDEDGSLVATPGYADIASAWPYALDHWAHDITRPIQNGQAPEFVTVGIHKGDTPHAVRGAIEEGFRRDDPDVNIVSATPTMELGVDIGTLDTVGQVGIPPTLTNYVQRSGRTGRSRGSSSLVMTAIRGTHPVDSHYYSNLETFLDDFEPVRVPDPFEFDELLATHVVTETFAYLARNPHESNVFEQMYSLQETKENLGVFVDEVTDRLDILREFILEERRTAITNHLSAVFGEPGVTVFDQVFAGDGPLALSNRAVKTFDRLVTMSGSADTNKNLVETNRRLDQWLQRLGYLANYRSFGQQFPVKFSGRRESIEFEGSGRLYDMFPGEANDHGAAMKLHGTDYLVDDVRGTTAPLTTVAVCENNECERPFYGYESETTRCPHCESELTETPIHGVSSVECTAARGGQRGYSTRGLLTTYVDPPDETVTSTETTLFGIPCELVYGERDVTDFVYAFERWHRAGAQKEVLRSEALIEQDGQRDTSSLSWRERMEDVQEEVYRPVGQQYFTQALTIRFDAGAFWQRVEQLGHDTASRAQALTSLEQAVTKAVAIVAECDQDDFRVSTRVGQDDDQIDLYIVDSRQGGNGISWQAQDRLHAVETRVREVAGCDRCVDYCDECLLLQRTPGYYLDNDLLDSRTLAAVVGLGERAVSGSEAEEPAE
jgi:ATP-dependent helicase YprA (DUF1998 family)